MIAKFGLMHLLVESDLENSKHLNLQFPGNQLLHLDPYPCQVKKKKMWRQEKEFVGDLERSVG